MGFNGGGDCRGSRRARVVLALVDFASDYIEPGTIH